MHWQWLHDYHLFLFDFDGLLVDSEPLHFAAYKRLCQQEGCEWVWSFERYCKAAHLNATSLKEELLQDYPKLTKHSWEILYEKKKKNFDEILNEATVELMPGALELLTKLHEEKIAHCVVTHSSKKHIDLMRKKQPLLNTIPHWFTREDYTNPKPSPDGYLKAISTLYQKGKIIGFEDSIKGLESLKQTEALPVLVADKKHPLLKETAPSNEYIHLSSLEELSSISTLQLAT